VSKADLLVKFHCKLPYGGNSNMRKIRIIALTSIVSVLAFVLAIYSSCNKDACKGVTCENGATNCIGGTCQCPAGYSGNFCELSSITFRNNSYTLVYINVSGATQTMAPDSSISFAGQPGLNASMYAYTFGVNAANEPVGDTIIWSNNYIFPANGALSNIPLNVYPQYFFLRMIDSNSSQSITSIYVNYGIAGAQTLDNITIPNDKKVHGVGYYKSYALTQVYAVSNTGNHWLLTPPTIPDTVQNESVTLTVN